MSRMIDHRHPTLADVARCALLAGALMVGPVGCGPAVSAGAATGNDPSPAPVLTYYLDQTFAARGQEVSERTLYSGYLKICKDAKAPTTPLSEADAEKLATKRRRIWQRPNERVVQTDTWSATAAPSTLGIRCLFNGTKEKSVREVHVLPQTLYVMDLSKGTVEVQTQAGPPTVSDPPMSLKAFEEHVIARGVYKKVGDGHVLGEPCVIWAANNPDHSLAYTECAWTGGLKNGVWPLSILLWRKPAATGLGDEWAIKTNEFVVGHLPPGSDTVFELPAHAKSPGGAGVAGTQP